MSWYKYTSRKISSRFRKCSIHFCFYVKNAPLLWLNETLEKLEVNPSYKKKTYNNSFIHIHLHPFRKKILMSSQLYMHGKVVSLGIDAVMVVFLNICMDDYAYRLLQFSCACVWIKLTYAFHLFSNITKLSF